MLAQIYQLPLFLVFRFLVWFLGWKVGPRLPRTLKKCVVIGAPHTSYWDFFMVCLYRYPLGFNRVIGLAKKELYANPFFNFVLKLANFIPVDRAHKNSVVSQIAEQLARYKRGVIVMAPEGTRSKTPDWRTGFYYIALESKIPIALAYADYRNKEVGIHEIFEPSGNLEQDLAYIQEQYTRYIPLKPQLSTLNFATDKKQGVFKIHVILMRFALIYLLCSSFIYRSDLVYGIEQLYGQLKILYQTESIEDYLAKHDYADSLQEKFKIIEEIKTYAHEHLGLNPSKSYETVYDQGAKPILRVITACKPYELKAKVWDFPLFGKFTYKGFFNPESLEKTKIALQREGYDLIVQNTTAWSTLGFFNDPILSSMLKAEVGSLANTLIHELTHSTIFNYDDLIYNENIANFIGFEGALLFLKDRYSDTSQIYRNYYASKTDKRTFNQYLNQAAKRLDSLYNIIKNDSKTDKALKKKSLIDDIVLKYKTLSFTNQRYKNYFNNYRPNNAFFIAFKNYNEKQSDFRKRYQTEFKDNLKAFIEALKTE